VVVAGIDADVLERAPQPRPGQRPAGERVGQRIGIAVGRGVRDALRTSRQAAAVRSGTSVARSSAAWMRALRAAFSSSVCLGSRYAAITAS
jgi:hypothetical protein